MKDKTSLQMRFNQGNLKKSNTCFLYQSVNFPYLLNLVNLISRLNWSPGNNSIIKPIISPCYRPDSIILYIFEIANQTLIYSMISTLLILSTERSNPPSITPISFKCFANLATYSKPTFWALVNDGCFFKFSKGRYLLSWSFWALALKVGLLTDIGPWFPL